MQKRGRSGSRQQELFVRSKRPVILIDENHRLVQLTERLDWTELEQVVESIRRSKLKSPAGRPPHLRALIGAVVFRAQRPMTYRDTEDQIRHDAPARYLCGLTETDWTPDANTLQDFEQLLGEDGTKRLNEYVVKEAVSEGLGDPKVMVADTTAQEAAIPHPNEMGLMATFVTAVCVAGKQAGGALKTFVRKAAELFQKAKRKVRAYRLIAKHKTQEAKNKMVGAMAHIVKKVQGQLGRALEVTRTQKRKWVGKKQMALAKLGQLHQTMKKLLPQIRYWLKTGRVAKDKIISLHIPELYSVVRGKVGKAVEFGLNWGIARLGGGFLLATLAKDRRELQDHRFALRAVDDHIAMFGSPPLAYAYDRGGYSKQNVLELKKKGVRQVGLAPRGRDEWSVKGRVKEQRVKERAQIEAGIGTIKSARYGFNRPVVRSVEMLGVCGQRAVLGFNLNKLIRQLSNREGIALIG